MLVMLHDLVSRAYSFVPLHSPDSLDARNQNSRILCADNRQNELTDFTPNHQISHLEQLCIIEIRT